MPNIYKIIKSTIIAESARLSYILSMPFFNKNIWIISETENQAQDNGYEFFCWLEKNTTDIDAFYVIDKHSPDIDKFRHRNNWLAVDSFKQIFYLYHANKIISTHGLWMIPNEFGILKKLTRKTLKAKKVMLQHGVNFIRNSKMYYHKSFFPLNDLWIASSLLEKDIFIHEYGYLEQDVVVTGLPRFDSLIDRSDQSKWPNMILFMPTFRDQEQGLNERFKETDLYLKIQALVDDKRLQQLLEEKNCHLAIYLHQNMQTYTQYLDPFANSRIHIIRQGELSIKDLLRMSKLLITDYSSVFFDFVYMNKPFISYQFDYHQFINSRADKPLHDIRTTLPGDVVSTHDELIDKILTLEKNQFTMSEVHRLKAAKHFTYNDQNNCWRVYQAISKF